MIQRFASAWCLQISFPVMQQVQLQGSAFLTVSCIWRSCIHPQNVRAQVGQQGSHQ